NAIDRIVKEAICRLGDIRLNPAKGSEPSSRIGVPRNSPPTSSAGARLPTGNPPRPSSDQLVTSRGNNNTTLENPKVNPPLQIFPEWGSAKRAICLQSPDSLDQQRLPSGADYLESRMGKRR